MLNDCMSNHEMLRKIEDGTYELGEGIITIGSYQADIEYSERYFKTAGDDFPATLNDIISELPEPDAVIVIYDGYNESMVFRYDGEKWNLCSKFDGCKEYL